MPPSAALAHSGLGVIGAILLLATVATTLTLIVSVLLVWRYRRSVGRLMSARASRLADAARTPGSASAQPPPHASDARVESIAEPDDSGVLLYRRTRSEPNRHACNYALAGAAFALLVALAAYFAFSQIQINFLAAAAHPLQFAFLFWTFAWPIVLTINIVAAGGRRNRWRNVLLYFVVLVVLGAAVVFTPTEPAFRLGDASLPAWSGESPLRLAIKWNLFNLAPTLLILIFRHGRLRAVAPLVLSFVTVVSAGVLGMVAAAFIYQEFSLRVIVLAAEGLGISGTAALIGYLAVLCLLACALFAVLGWLVLLWIRRQYQGKRASDQSLAVDALWLMFATFYAMMLATAGPAWALAMPLAYLLFKLALGAGNRILGRDDGSYCRAPALLVLRVFALGKRSEALFDALARRWRPVGTVELIAGTDLALSTVAPHRFLAFVGGRMDRLFIRDAASLRDSVSAMDRERDADGRFRINDFFCHADTWQAALAALLQCTDVVLMDLRSLAASNAGCVFEIRELVNTVPVERLVFVVDASTDREFLQQTWEDVCRELRADSPNSRLRAPALQTFDLDSLGHSATESLLRRICAAAASGRIRPATS